MWRPQVGFTGSDRTMLRSLVQAVQTLNGKVDKVSENQAGLDQRVQQLNDIETRNAAALASVQQELDDLKNQPGAQALDFSGVDTAIANAGSQESTLEGMESPAAPSGTGDTSATPTT